MIEQVNWRFPRSVNGAKAFIELLVVILNFWVEHFNVILNWPSLASTEALDAILHI